MTVTTLDTVRDRLLPLMPDGAVVMSVHMDGNGHTRRIDPEFHGVIYDSRKHMYDGLQAFYTAVREAKAKAERNEVAA